jgi:hypothetical protein
MKSAFARTAGKVRILLSMQAWFLAIGKHPEGRPELISRKELTTWEYHHVKMTADRQRRNNVDQAKALADGSLTLIPAADGKDLTYPQWLLNKVPGEDCPFHAGRGMTRVPWQWIDEQAAEAAAQAAMAAKAAAAAKAAIAAAAAKTAAPVVTPPPVAAGETPVAETPAEEPVAEETPAETPVTSEAPANETRKQRREREAKERAAKGE